MAKRFREDNENITQQGTPEECHTPKFMELDVDIDDSSSPAMQCTLPPHKTITFASYQDFESHYNQAHVNQCRECLINLPTSHYLELHLAENHDPIIATKRDQGVKTFACFMEDCDKICMDWKKRRSHLIDKHGFPKNFDFLLVDNGIDRKRSLLRPGIDAQGHRKSSRERQASSLVERLEVTNATPPGIVFEGNIHISNEAMRYRSTVLASSAVASHDASVDEISKSMSSLQFVPKTVRFGHKGKAGLAKN